MYFKKLFFSLISTLLFLRNSAGKSIYKSGIDAVKDANLMDHHRVRRGASEIYLHHPLQFRSQFDDRRYFLKPPMHVRRTLPFQLVAQPKASGLNGQSFPLHFSKIGSPFSYPYGKTEDKEELSKTSSFDGDEEEIPPIPTTSAVTRLNNITPNDLMSMLRGISSEVDVDNPRSRIRFGLF